MLWLAIVYTETVTYKLKQASCGWSRSDDTILMNCCSGRAKLQQKKTD